MKLLHYCLYSKSASTMRWCFRRPEMRVNMFFFFLALGVDCTARDVMKAKFTGIPTYSLASYTLHSVV